MSHIESESPDPWLQEKSEKEKFKKEVREEVLGEMKRKKRRKFLSCCLLEFLCLLVILFLGATVVAKTGLFEIPFFSKVFYKTPEPTREVTVEEVKNLEEILQEKVKSQVEEKIKPEIQDQEIEIELEFTEEELTAFLKEGVEGGVFPFSQAQTVITPEEIEFFGESKDLIKAFFTVWFRPEVEDNQLIIRLTKFKLGNLPLPTFLGNFLVERFLGEKLQEISEVIGKGGKLEDIELEDGKLKFKGIVNVLILLERY